MKRYRKIVGTATVKVFLFYILDLGMKYDLVLGMLDCFDLGVWIRFDFVLGFLFENVASQFYLLFFLIVFYSFFFIFLGYEKTENLF